jgi:hypothetical protein
MARSIRAEDLVQIDGDSADLVDRLREPLRRALAGRHRYYAVHVDSVGRVGEVLVSISGSTGRLPLLLGRDELDPGYVSRVVSDAVQRFAV